MTETTLATRPVEKRNIVVGNRGLAPSNFEEIWRLASAYAQSGMAPRGLERPEALAVAMMTGMELGISPMASIRSIAVINGKASIYGDGAKALIEASGLCEQFTEHFEGEGDKRTAVCTVKRKGRDAETTRFSVSDAIRAGLWKKNDIWQKYPDRMLQMRSRSWRMRDTFPDVLQGIGIAEEVADIPVVTELPPSVTPAERVIAKAQLLPAPDGSTGLTAPSFPYVAGAEPPSGITVTGCSFSSTVAQEAAASARLDGDTQSEPDATDQAIAEVEQALEQDTRAELQEHFDQSLPEKPTHPVMPDNAPLTWIVDAVSGITGLSLDEVDKRMRTGLPKPWAKLSAALRKAFYAEVCNGGPAWLVEGK